jgi:hypothetical protein
LRYKVKVKEREMKVIVEINDYYTQCALKDMQQTMVITEPLNSRKLGKALAQNIIDRYYGVEHFDYEETLEDMD